MLSVDDINKLQEENERLKKENEILLGQLVINDGEDVTVQISKNQFDEYNQFKDMAKKGLDEFKDVGGCCGCGIQLSLNQSWDDCKKYRTCLQEIKEILLQAMDIKSNAYNHFSKVEKAMQLIDKAEV